MLEAVSHNRLPAACRGPWRQVQKGFKWDKGFRQAGIGGQAGACMLVSAPSTSPVFQVSCIQVDGTAGGRAWHPADNLMLTSSPSREGRWTEHTAKLSLKSPPNETHCLQRAEVICWNKMAACLSHSQSMPELYNN